MVAAHEKKTRSDEERKGGNVAFLLPWFWFLVFQPSLRGLWLALVLHLEEIGPFNAVQIIRGRLKLRLGKRPKIRKLRDLMAFVVSGGHPNRFHHVLKPLGLGRRLCFKGKLSI